MSAKQPRKVSNLLPKEDKRSETEIGWCKLLEKSDSNQNLCPYKKNKCMPITLNLSTSHEMTGMVRRQEEL